MVPFSGLTLRHRMIQRALRHELDVFVDGEHQVVAGLRLARFAAQHMPLGIERGQHVSGRPVQVVIEAALQPTQAVVVGAHVAQHLRAPAHRSDRSA